MKITVNGKEVEADSPLSYEAAVQAGLWKDGDSVMYQGPRVGDLQRAGILGPGKSVELVEGMRFSAAYTGNA